jgi:hypothetical protein
MSQHPRAKEMGLAAETAEFTFDEKTRDWCIDCGANHIATVYPNVDETAPETEIMADSLNVMNQTGRTPSELVELVRVLRGFTERLYHVSHITKNCEAGVMIEQLLEKTEDFA